MGGRTIHGIEPFLNGQPSLVVVSFGRAVGGLLFNERCDVWVMQYCLTARRISKKWYFDNAVHMGKIVPVLHQDCHLLACSRGQLRVSRACHILASGSSLLYYGPVDYKWARAVFTFICRDSSRALTRALSYMC